MPDEPQEELQEEEVEITTRDLNCEFSIGKGNKQSKSGIHFQVWFNSWRDFGFGTHLNTPWFSISQGNYFSKGGSVPSAIVRLVGKMVESGWQKTEVAEPKDDGLSGGYL